MSDRTRQVREHDEQVQDLLRTVSSRDQHIQVEQRSRHGGRLRRFHTDWVSFRSMQDAAGRLTEVLNEQASRVQELRRQLSSKPDAAPELTLEVQALQDELRLVLAREKENQEERRSQAGRLESLSRSLKVKEEIIGVSERERDHLMFRVVAALLVTCWLVSVSCRSFRGRWWRRQTSLWWRDSPRSSSS